MFQLDETWQRISETNKAAGVQVDWTATERGQMEALADDLNRALERHPIIHAWRTSNGRQLQFWCKFCKDYHTHGRHGSASEFNGKDSGSLLPVRLWRQYVRKYADCTYRFGRGFCTCPIGSGDGHRAPHCWNRKPGHYYEHGYILREVEPNDARALQKPNRFGGVPYSF